MLGYQSRWVGLQCGLVVMYCGGDGIVVVKCCGGIEVVG